MKANNFITRSISGTLFVILLTACIFIHPIAFYALFFIINVICLYEFSKMAERGGKKLNIPLFIISGSLLFTAGFLDAEYDIMSAYFLCFLAAYSLSISELFRKGMRGFQNLAFSYYGLIYISLPFTLLLYFPRITTDGNESWNAEIVYVPFLLVWANDSFAYICGRLFGKHKLFPRISPKKTWEGAIGGGLITIAIAIIIAYFWKLSLIQSSLLGLIVVIFGIFGDLIESMFKRNIEIKDSGKIMPGHGGLLDRFDAVLFVIPAVFVYFECIKFFK